MPVPDATRSHIRTDFMQSLIDRGRPHAESLRNLVDIHPPVVEGTDDFTGEGKSASVDFPAFPCVFGPSQHGHVVWRCRALRQPLCNGTAGEPRFVELDRISLELD